MRRKREPKSDQDRGDRLGKYTYNLNQRMSAKDDALDAAVQKSIRLHGA